DTYTAVNMKIIRLSEVYLNAAEAALKKPNADPAKAAEYLNAIRKRSPSLAPVSPSQVNEELILKEKSKELYGEGFRYWDMIRTNQTITFNDEHVGVNLQHREKSIDRTFFKAILPIPRTELDANPVIVPEQNPGY